MTVPTDPRYVRFRDGVLVAHKDVPDTLRWRWHPKDATWYKYPTVQFILDDIGLPDTNPGSSFDLIFDEEDYVARARADSWLPDLFARLEATYSKWSLRYPHLVWTWRNGGDWRAASSRNPGEIPDPTPEDPDWRSKLSPMCLQRVADVEEWVRRGTITAAVGQQLINQIVADCTVG